MPVTIRDLIAYLQQLPQNAPVILERVEDVEEDVEAIALDEALEAIEDLVRERLHKESRE